MATTAQVSPATVAEGRSAAEFSLGRHVRAIVARVSAWATARADHLAAAAIYEELSRLSDAELRDRSLSRATLARDVRESMVARKAG